MAKKPHIYDKVVFLLQGGGALGAYQVGACEALLEYGCTPDWLVGTSIGAINAAIIAGNTPENRIKKLKLFWGTIASPIPEGTSIEENDALHVLQKGFSSLWTIAFGQEGFFKPRLVNPWLNMSGYPDQISFYDTSELKSTLEELIDFNLINQKKVRLTLAALCLENGELVYFDNEKQEIRADHVMASGALPPGFPAIKIDGKNYWDGGLSSNTPLNAILEEDFKNKLLCIMMHLFSYHQSVPTNMLEVLKLKKDIEYSSRYHEVLKHLCEIKHLHNLLHQLAKEDPNLRNEKNMIEILKNSNPVSINIVRFHYRNIPGNLWSKDFEFSPQTLIGHSKSGYHDVNQALKNPDWLLNHAFHSVKLREF